MVFIALVCALFTQRVRLNQLNASLSRYEQSVIPTTLELTQFRIIPRIVLDKDHCKVATYRIESKNRHTAVVRNGSGTSSKTSSYDQTTDLHFSEISILIDHIKSTNTLKYVRDQGYSVTNAGKDFLLDDAVTLHPDVRVCNRNETIDLFQVDGDTCTFTMQP